MIFKTALVGTDHGEIYKIEIIESAGELWLVPEWIDTHNPPGKKPRRAIRLTGLDYERSPNPDADYFLKRSIPKAILFGPTPPEGAGEFVVVDRLDGIPTERPN